jgi:hypothetical protein
VLVTVSVYFAANFDTGTPDPPGGTLTHLTPDGSILLTKVLAGQEHVLGWTVQVKPLGSGYITGPGATVNRHAGGGIDLSWYTTASSAAQIIGFEVLAAADAGQVLFMRRAFPLGAFPSVVAGQAIQVALWIIFGS